MENKAQDDRTEGDAVSNNKTKSDISEFKYIKAVSVGSINPNVLLTDEGREQQMEILNRCLNDYPKGVIIGKDIAIGRYMLGEHELTLQRTVYHVGFLRKPAWAEKKSEGN